MTKQLIVFNIKKEKARIAFAAAINEINENSVEIIDQHAIAFESNKTHKEIFKIILEKTGIECPPDEFYVFTLGKSFFGNGITTDGLKKLLMKR
jgi:hypothetical protein